MSELPPELYDHDGDRDNAEVDSWSRDYDEDEEEDELEECMNCGRFACICSDETLEETENEDGIADISPEVRRYLDRELHPDE